MPINFYTENLPFNLKNKNSLKNWITEIISFYNQKCGEISYIFLNDEEIRKMNRDYLNHDYATDVITFDYSENNIINGDIFIGYDTILSNSHYFKVSFLQELHRVMIHGVLHLLGYDDSTPALKEDMHRKENDALSRLNRN